MKIKFVYITYINKIQPAKSPHKTFNTFQSVQTKQGVPRRQPHRRQA